MMPFPVPPPAIQATVPETSLNNAVEAVLQDFDAEDPAVPLRDPLVAPADQPSLRWLRSAALAETPSNPFRRGTASHKEAEALVNLLKADRDQAERLLPKLQVREPGTALALWRWAKRQERAKPWNLAIRHRWEDKLMAKELPSMLIGYALRHGLCWALAEKDEARFAELKEAWGEDAPSLVASFQGLFGRLGGISPSLRLWTLPGLDYEDQRLDLLLSFEGGKPSRIWISPGVDEDGGTGAPAMMPAHTAWIVPSASGSQNLNQTALTPVEKSAGTTLSARVAAAKGRAYFAPSRTEFEALGLVFFPILIDLDAKGAIQGIQMGDAAPRRP